MDALEVAAISALTQGVEALAKVGLAPLQAYSENLTERIKARLSAVADAAEHKTGDRPVEVSDRLASRILGEGAFADDLVVADYLGGVLAAASPDDDAASIVALIGRLSVVQLKLHYVVYRALIEPARSIGLDWLGYEGGQPEMIGIEIRLDEVLRAVGVEDRAVIVSAIRVLQREDLLASPVLIGSQINSPRPDDSVWLEAHGTRLGAELFLWGHGQRPAVAERLFDINLDAFLAEVAACPSVDLTTAARAGGVLYEA